MIPKLLAIAVLLAFLLMWVGCRSLERKLLYFPSHDSGDGGMTPWEVDGERIGFSRSVETPDAIWLLMHGNGGQASNRSYALPCFSERDSVYILEYPGYGERDGRPSRTSFDAATEAAYRWLRAQYPDMPICAAGESIGTGPASHLGSLELPPEKIVLITPYDRLGLVAEESFPKWLVALALRSDWDNAASLAAYKGPVEIFGAEEDRIIPVRHARSLSDKLPNATFHLIEGGHNEWSEEGRVRIRYP